MNLKKFLRIGLLSFSILPAMVYANNLAIHIEELDVPASMQIFSPSNVPTSVGITNGQTVNHNRMENGNYTLKIMSGSAFNCNDAGDPAMSPKPIDKNISEIYLAVDTYTRKCVTSTEPPVEPPPVEPGAILLNFFVKGTVDQGSQKFYIHPYNEAGGELRPSSMYTVAIDTWGTPASKTFEMPEGYDYAIIEVGNRTCFYDRTTDPEKMNQPEADVVLDLTQNANCELHENFVPPVVTPIDLNMNINTIGIETSGKDVVMSIDEYYEDAVSPYLQTPATLDEDYLNVNDSKKIENANYDHAKITMKAEGSSFINECAFPDGSMMVKNVDPVYINFGANRDLDETPRCLLYQEPVEEEINITFDFTALDVSLVGIEVHQLENGSNSYDWGSLDNKDVYDETFNRGKFTEYSYVIINEIPELKLYDPIECQFENGSKKITSDINEVTVTATMDVKSQTINCQLSQ